VYDTANPSDVKYAGMVHLSASAACPGLYCLHHFVTQPDGVTPVFPYQVATGAAGGPGALDVPATDIEWNALGDGLPHTLLVEAVDQLGPAPHGSLYTGLQSTPLVAGGMLGANKGATDDGKSSTNGQGPFTNNPQVIARSEPFVAQANRAYAPIPSRSDASQTFLDTFDNAEGSTIKQITRQDATTDAMGNLGYMTYSMNAGTPKEWALEYRQADNQNSMPFIGSNHFMDMLFDGATPNTSAPTHTVYGSMAMTPKQTFNIGGGQVAHLTMEVDAHASFRRWTAFDLAPASDPLQGWDPLNHPINNTDQGIFLEVKDGFCTLDIFTGPTSSTNVLPTGTAGGSHGARLWGQSGASGGGAVMCELGSLYNPSDFRANGLGLDDRSRWDFYISATHAALFIDGKLIVQSDIPAGSFPFANQPLKAYYTHYMYHSDADIYDLENVKVNGAGICYPQNSYWFNEPTTGTSAMQDVCDIAYPAGYGFPHSDERHWDNLGFETVPTLDVASGDDFSVFGSNVQPISPVAPQFGGAPAAAPTATTAPTTLVPTSTPMSMPSNTPTSVATSTPTTVPTSLPPPPAPANGPGPSGQWVNVTPGNVNLTSALDCGNFGAQTVVVDPARPSNLYAEFNCQGIWRSTDYGQTWEGPINTGTNGAIAGDCAGGIAIAPGSTGSPPILYQSCIRGAATGFWRSQDGGVSWTKYNVGPGGTRQDWYPPSVDPSDANHLIMAAHEQNLLTQSTDGGQTWSAIPMASGMNENGGTAFVFFINTGNATATRSTWLYMAQGTGGVVGTWRTSSAGATWTRVDSNEHPHGDAQIYQPDAGGVVYMAGVYSAGGWGVERSTDYGQTWTHVGPSTSEALVFGTPNGVYSQYGWACGIGCTVATDAVSAAQPGTSGWLSRSMPVSMAQGPGEAAVVYNGTQYVILTANWASGLWRYVEPNSGAPNAAPTATSVPAPANTPTALPTSTPVSRPTNTPTTLPTATAVPGTSSAGYASSATVSPSSLNRGQSEAITASVASSPGSTALVDVEVYDPSGTKVFQQAWDNQSFANGQPQTFTATWSVPSMAATGGYIVRIGVFAPGWGPLRYSNPAATAFTVQ
jgi:hypothetical protein